MLPPHGPPGYMAPSQHPQPNHEGSHQSRGEASNHYDNTYFGAMPGMSNLNNLMSNNSTNTNAGGNNMGSLSAMNNINLYD